MKTFEKTNRSNQITKSSIYIRFIVMIITGLFLTVLFPGQTFAQNQAKVNSESKNGLTTTTFETPEGSVKVFLPSDFSSGEKISGTVQLAPSGKNDRQIQKNAGELSGYVVEMENQEAKAGKGKATFLVPATAAAGAVTYLILKDNYGNPVASQRIPLQNSGLNSGRLTEPGFKIPDQFSSTQPIEIPGSFDGDFGNSDVLFDGQPADILAESEHGVFVQTPDGVTGPVDVTISENGQTVSATTNVLDLSLSADQLHLQNGQTATVTLTVSGLEGIDQPVDVIITNLTPNVISMTGGMTNQITITPADVAANGTFVHNFPVNGNTPGSFSIAAEILPANGHNLVEPETYSPTTPETTGPTDPVNETPQDINNFLDANNFQDPGPANPEDFDRPEFNGSALATNTFSDISYGPSVTANFINPAILATIIVNIPDDERRRYRNEARGLPEDTPMTPSAPNDNDAPYSRPVPPGLGGDDYESGDVWSNPDSLLARARREVTRAGQVTGVPSPGVPGFGTIGLTSPHSTTVNHETGCTEYVYYFHQRYTYLDDVTLVHEEQLSPSFEFFVANGTTKIDITQHTSSWEVEAGVSAGIRGVEVGISGKYGESTTRITGGSVSRIVGRHLWLFHIGRLYLYRKAFLRITYEYHYEVCPDGSTNNWVVTTYSDNWYYAYRWIESLIIASKDDEGNFHEVQTFPLGSSTVEEDQMSYEVDSLDRSSFDNPGDWDFFPQVQ